MSIEKLSIFLEVLGKILQFLHILGTLGKNLVKIFTKGFRKMQDSWQEFQDILHWVLWPNVLRVTNRKEARDHFRGHGMLPIAVS